MPGNIFISFYRMALAYLVQVVVREYNYALVNLNGVVDFDSKDNHRKKMRVDLHF